MVTRAGKNNDHPKRTPVLKCRHLGRMIDQMSINPVPRAEALISIKSADRQRAKSTPNAIQLPCVRLGANAFCQASFEPKQLHGRPTSPSSSVPLGFIRPKFARSCRNRPPERAGCMRSSITATAPYCHQQCRVGRSDVMAGTGPAHEWRTRLGALATIAKIKYAVKCRALSLDAMSSLALRAAALPKTKEPRPARTGRHSPGYSIEKCWGRVRHDGSPCRTRASWRHQSAVILPGG